MTFAVLFTSEAERQLSKLPKATQSRIVTAIERLAAAPRAAANVKRLVGTSAYRLRVGEHRVVYELEDQRLTIVVIRIAHRREVYR